jgi:hypothetical protein
VQYPARFSFRPLYAGGDIAARCPYLKAMKLQSNFRATSALVSVESN